MTTFDDSMHCGDIKQDTTDHVPQVMSNMTRFKNTISIKAKGNRSPSSYELQDASSSRDDVNEDNNGDNNGENYHIDDEFDDIDIDIDEDIELAFNQIDITQKKNKNIINLRKHSGGDVVKRRCCNILCDKCCYSLPIFHPHGNLRISWDCIIMIILIYTCIEIPYTLAFGINLTLQHPFGVIALCIDCLLLIDIIFNFRTAYFDEFDHQMLICDPPRIAWKYFTTWFILDFLTSVPFEFIIPEGAAGNFPSLLKILRIFRMVRLLKLLRFFRMLKTFNSIIASFMTRSILIIAKLFKLLCLMTLSAHFVACLWFYVGKQSYKKYGAGETWLYPDADDPGSSLVNEANSEQYLTSFYFAVVTLYTTGYGDITPKSRDEKLACSACILVGTCFFAYFIGAVGSLVAEGDRVKCAQIQKIEEAQAFCSSKKLPAPVAHALMSHAKYHWERNFVFDDMDVINSLPGYLRRDIGNCLSEKYFNECEIFKDLSPYIRGLIALRLRCVSCNADYELFHANQYGKELFIQRTGISYLLDHKKEIHKVTRGGVIGYYALLNPVRQTTLKCASWCEFYALDRDDIQDILRANFPRAWRPLWLKIKSRIKALYEKNKATLNISIKRDKDITFTNNNDDDRNLNTKSVPSQPLYQSINTKSTNSIFTESTDSLDVNNNKNNKGLRRVYTMGRRLSSQNVIVVQKAAKTAKTGTKRKFKKILQVSDSEMRDDKVKTKPPINKFKKHNHFECRYKKKLKLKMMRKRKKREFRGIDEIIPIFNNNKPILAESKDYFQNIINEENVKIKQEEKEEEEEYEEESIDDSELDGYSNDYSSEGNYQNDEDSMEWGLHPDDDSDFDVNGGGGHGKKRGVSCNGAKRSGGFKGIKKIKMNKKTRGIKSVRTPSTSGIKKKKHKKKHNKQRSKSVTPKSRKFEQQNKIKSKSISPKPSKIDNNNNNIHSNKDIFSKSIIEEIGDGLKSIEMQKLDGIEDDHKKRIQEKLKKLSMIEFKANKNNKTKSDEIIISISEKESLLNDDNDNNNNNEDNTANNKLRAIDEHTSI